MAEHIKDGTADGLIEFVDYLIEKGYVPRAAGSNWKGASRTVLSTVEGEEFGSIQVSEIALEDYLARFDVLARGKIKQESAKAYSKRFQTALEAYKSFLTDADWKPPTVRQGSPKRKTSADPTTHRDEEHGRLPSSSETGPRMDSPDLIDYPFPLRSGQIARVRLPAQLDKNDAERLATFVRTLVFEPQRQLPAGDERLAA